MTPDAQPAPDAVAMALAEYRQLALKVNGTPAMTGPKDLAFHVRRDAAARAANAAKDAKIEAQGEALRKADDMMRFLGKQYGWAEGDPQTAYRAARAKAGA